MTQALFSDRNPLLRTIWDSSALGTFQFCPRRYRYEHIEGWRGASADLEFGIRLHHGVELYWRARIGGESPSSALFEALSEAIRSTILGGGEVWGGRYEVQWRCTGTEPYKNEKGNRAKCPYAKVGAWQIGSGPSQCGECGSETEAKKRWLPDKAGKDRLGLARALVAYCDENADCPPPVEVNGKAHVETAFLVPLALTSKQGEPYYLAGKLDRIDERGGEWLVCDVKTTGKGLGKSFFDGYNPSLQFDLYDMVFRRLFPHSRYGGIRIEALACLANGVDYGVQTIRRLPSQRVEAETELKWHIQEAERCAEEAYFPRRTRNCWLCAFKRVCAQEPGKREHYLRADFQRVELHNPLGEEQ